MFTDYIYTCLCNVCVYAACAAQVRSLLGEGEIIMSGRPLVWDATCCDTYAASYRGLATSEAGCVAASSEEKKAKKYARLGPTYVFQPVAIETSGTLQNS